VSAKDAARLLITDRMAALPLFQRLGAIGGVSLGAREGISTFAANAFADPEHHAVVTSAP